MVREKENTHSKYKSRKKNYSLTIEMNDQRTTDGKKLNDTV